MPYALLLEQVLYVLVSGLDFSHFNSWCCRPAQAVRAGIAMH